MNLVRSDLGSSTDSLPGPGWEGELTTSGWLPASLSERLVTWTPVAPVEVSTELGTIFCWRSVSLHSKPSLASSWSEPPADPGSELGLVTTAGGCSCWGGGCCWLEEAGVGLSRSSSWFSGWLAQASG